MNQETFNKLRVCFFIQSCPRCRILCEFIERINFKLPYSKQIKMVDCTLYQNYRVLDNPLIALYNKSFDGFPCVFFGNTKISGANTRFQSEAFLKGLFEEDFIYPEQSEGKFNKECFFSNKGIFKHKVICKD